MNIALFSDCFVPIKNGVVTSVQQLKEGLEKKGHKVIVITVEVPGYEEKDPKVFRLPSFKAQLGKGTEQRVGIFNQAAINRYLKNQNIDIIHTHTEFMIGYCGKWASKKLKIPHIHTTHTMWEEYRHYILNGKLISKGMARGIIKTYLSKVDLIISPSIKAKKYYKELLPKIPVKIVHNGINMQKFKSSPISNSEILELRKEFNLKKTDKILIFVGRIGKEKRVMDLLNVIIPLLKKRNNLKMLFVGDGPQLEELQKKAKSEGVLDSIVFTGFVNWEMVHTLYSMSNMFLTCSLSEVQPMTMIEASMCSLPLIVRRDDSYLDLVKDGESGYIVDSDEELAQRVESLLDNEELLAKFSGNSYKHSQSFTADNHVNNAERVYERVLEYFPDRLHLLEYEDR